MGCHSLLQGIFPTQGLNSGLLHCRLFFHCLSQQGNPFCYRDLFNQHVFLGRAGKLKVCVHVLFWFISPFGSPTLPLNNTVGEQWRTPVEGGCPRGQHLDFWRGQSCGWSRRSSQLCCWPLAATIEASAGLHPNGVGREGLQAVQSLLGGQAFSQL